MSMISQAYWQIDSARRLASVAVAIMIAAAGAGCGTLMPAPTTTESIATTPAAGGDQRGAMENWGERYRANPRDPVVAINYAQALRAIGQRAQAAAVLEQAS